ncbi:uncharacterized protein J4E84_000928 [Alternaria hordeiaustralica]|uniref:uncharacterized protein n=1 Tax=Alternaria hordeiaustralica TaxID=1187925 RepID=UPI0020C43AFE|nr:uncharacterized protein J4E84_000928 [Alternaria hordeiaustralica]KAI4697795.1 hypothetical protein J4E84_000928 [Alternaria hordeiaustralica]
MSTHAAQLLEQQFFSTLKAQIIGLAVPLYGTRSEDASKVYDVVTYSMTTNNGGSSNDSRSTFNTASTSSSNDGEEKAMPTHGVALILYTGPPSSPFTSWTLISHVEDQPDIITGANCLLEDLRKGMGGVISNWGMKHGRIPNVAGVGEEGQEVHPDVEYEHGGDGGDNMDVRRGAEGSGGRMDDASEDLGQTGWSPRLSKIIEEV